jgi:hypothetical protein
MTLKESAVTSTVVFDLLVSPARNRETLAAQQ